MYEQGQFFDAETGGPIQVVLVATDRPDRFRLGRRCGYAMGGRSSIAFPDEDLRFETDLTSVPRLLTWLVPKMGTHLPAALLHDWLVRQSEALEPRAAAQERRRADTIFRDSMGALGVPVVLRWLMWAAVSMATITGHKAPRKTYYRILAALTASVIIAVGTLATRDLVVDEPLLFWMRGPGTAGRILGGAFGAVVVPMVLSIGWFPRWREAAIAGVALALLLHVTAAIVLVYVVYLAAEFAFRPLGRLRPVTQPSRVGPAVVVSEASR